VQPYPGSGEGYGCTVEQHEDARLKRGYRWHDGDQVPTRRVTIEEIMAQPHFMLGVADVRALRGYRPDYDSWAANDQWGYDRGRIWATLAPKSLAVRRGGKINPDAVRLYARHEDEIL
jgi:hypothetical protein